MDYTNELKDRAALKELVDTFSNLADTKEVHAQVQLFTPNATSETFVNGASVSKLTGRDELEKAFGAFLANFETVYHFNGQQIFSLNGAKASGTSYCMVTLIANENGRKMKTTIGVIYQDEFVRENNHWLIAKRKANFNWQEKQPLGQ
ncbi:nuclear transport factor 2 family protein [Dyadobacter sp. CY327]|uniref:nuclear transport factor 2 family protein n=1 Tax=Dyadobacter sp. CY327 TaxID=2907301 RepID=UPI001F33406B|nr:nuclear transport factor 2 family protein [Dyadobacter sp. CY327]MCE7072173.1 nuclear transport factor 2 family protein [Dyadobacter sp. CY327]